MILALRTLSVLLGFIALICCYGYSMLFTLIAGPLGIMIWFITKRLDRQKSIDPLSNTLALIGILTNGLGLVVSLAFIIVFGMF